MSPRLPRCDLVLLFALQVELRALWIALTFLSQPVQTTATKEQGGNSRPSKQKTDCFVFVVTSE